MPVADDLSYQKAANLAVSIANRREEEKGPTGQTSHTIGRLDGMRR
jgi:hypothetical protein